MVLVQAADLTVRSSTEDDQFKTPEQTHCYNFTLMAVIMTATLNLLYIWYYLVTAMPGNHLHNGIILGFAELFGGVFSGALVQKMSDKNTFALLILLCFLANTGL